MCVSFSVRGLEHEVVARKGTGFLHAGDVENLVDEEEEEEEEARSARRQWQASVRCTTPCFEH